MRVGEWRGESVFEADKGRGEAQEDRGLENGYKRRGKGKGGGMGCTHLDWCES